MNLPGFTADSAIGASHKQYRMSPSYRGPVGVMPQSELLCRFRLSLLVPRSQCVSRDLWRLMSVPLPW